MFGYISVNSAQLSPEALSRYKACYCGLCRALDERHGAGGRLTLSNDMTFLLILLNALYEPQERAGAARCPLHPLKPRAFAQSAATAYAADMNLVLSYYKCLDHQADDHDPFQGAQARMLEKGYHQAAALYPRQCNAVARSLKEIGELEKQGSTNVDALCNLSGEMLGEIFVWREDCWAPLLRSLGAGLGRFVYFMDAYEDYDADRRRKRFNPLRELHALPDYEEMCLDTLRLLVAEATEAFEMLPLEQDLDILKNVMYTGVWTRYARLHKREKKEKERSDGQ